MVLLRTLIRLRSVGSAGGAREADGESADVAAGAEEDEDEGGCSPSESEMDGWTEWVLDLLRGGSGGGGPDGS